MHKLAIISIFLLIPMSAFAEWEFSETGWNTTRVEGRIQSTGRDKQLDVILTRGLSNIPVKLYVMDSTTQQNVATLQTTTDINGDFSFSGSSGYLSGSFEFDIEAIYHSPLVEILTSSQTTYMQREILPVDPDRHITINDNGPYAWQLASGNQLTSWAQDEDLFGPEFDTITIQVGPSNGGASTGGGSNSITLGHGLDEDINDRYDQGSLAHELGHVILFSHDIHSHDVMARLSDCNTSLECYIAPDGLAQRFLFNDGNPQSSTVARPLLKLHEEFSNFFGAAALDSIWPTAYRNNSPKIDDYELNVGGRDVYFGSEYDAPSPTVHMPYIGVQVDQNISGDIDRDYFVFPFYGRLPYSGSESTMLWDLYDDNSFSGDVRRITYVETPASYGDIKRWTVSFEWRLDRICFRSENTFGAIDDIYYSAARRGYFSQAAMNQRESTMDTLSIPIGDLVSAIAKYGNNSHMSISNRIARELGVLVTNWSDFTDVMRLHSNYVSFRSYYSPFKYIRHQNAEGHADSREVGNADFEWRIVPSLSKPEDPNYVSLESVNFPGAYLSHQNWLVDLYWDDGSSLFAQDASWKFSKITSADNNSFQIESLNYPGYVIAPDSSGRLSIQLKSSVGNESHFRAETVLPMYADYNVTNSSVQRCP